MKENDIIKMSREEYRQRFEIEFKYLCRLLKEHGNYKFIIGYIFSHDNKSKDDLFKTMCKHKTAYFGTLFYPSLKKVLDYIPLIGYRLDTYSAKESEYWRNNIQETSTFLSISNSEGFINFGKKIYLTD